MFNHDKAFFSQLDDLERPENEFPWDFDDVWNEGDE